MIGLLRLLRESAGAVEVDLLRFWQVDLLDYLRTPRTLSTRRLCHLVAHIPKGQGSAVRSLHGPEWTTTDDLLDEIRRYYVMAHVEGHVDPGPHPDSPAADKGIEVPPAEVVALAKRRIAEREAILAAEADGT